MRRHGNLGPWRSGRQLFIVRSRTLRAFDCRIDRSGGFMVRARRRWFLRSTGTLARRNVISNFMFDVGVALAVFGLAVIFGVSEPNMSSSTTLTIGSLLALMLIRRKTLQPSRRTSLIGSNVFVIMPTRDSKRIYVSPSSTWSASRLIRVGNCTVMRYSIRTADSDIETSQDPGESLALRRLARLTFDPQGMSPSTSRSPSARARRSSFRESGRHNATVVPLWNRTRSPSQRSTSLVRNLEEEQ